MNRAREGSTASVRDELVRVRAHKACDRRAELAGLLRSAGTLSVLGGGGFELEATSEHAGVARRIYEALGDAVGARGEVRLLEPGRGHPRQRYAVRARVASLQRLVETGVLDGHGAPGPRVPRRIVANRCCAGAYLRGVFLSRGSVSDPRAPAHIEFRADSEATADDISSLLTKLGATAAVRSHRGWAAYCKSVQGIGTILAAMGAHDSYLAWEDGSVWKSVHVEAGRLANADAGNARRVARAAVAHLAAIEEVDRAVGMRALPPALREAAELRVAHRDASLDELARMCDPPVSKAALADRLRRIAALAGGRFEGARSDR